MLRKLSSILQNDFLRLILDWKEDWWIFFRALFDLLSRSEIYRKKFSRFWTRLGIQDMSPLAKTDNSNMLLKIKLHLPVVRTVDYFGCHITNKEDWLLTIQFLCTSAYFQELSCCHKLEFSYFYIKLGLWSNRIHSLKYERFTA